MPSYHYEAADTAGQIERGQLDADSPRGLVPLDIKETGRATGAAGALFAKQINGDDLGWLTRLIAKPAGNRPAVGHRVVGHAGAGRETPHRPRPGDGAGRLRAGHCLAEALTARPRDFPNIYRALGAAGEKFRRSGARHGKSWPIISRSAAPCATKC